MTYTPVGQNADVSLAERPQRSKERVVGCIRKLLHEPPCTDNGSGFTCQINYHELLWILVITPFSIPRYSFRMRKLEKTTETIPFVE